MFGKYVKYECLWSEFARLCYGYLYSNTILCWYHIFLCSHFISHKTCSRDVILNNVVSDIEVWQCGLLEHGGADIRLLVLPDLLHLLAVVVEVHVSHDGLVRQHLLTRDLDPVLYRVFKYWHRYLHLFIYESAYSTIQYSLYYCFEFLRIYY